jgi:hypothetical protein
MNVERRVARRIEERPRGRWYKNCLSIRKRGGKICQDCPFREMIESYEKAIGAKDILGAWSPATVAKELSDA